MFVRWVEEAGANKICLMYLKKMVLAALHFRHLHRVYSQTDI